MALEEGILRVLNQKGGRFWYYLGEEGGGAVSRCSSSLPMVITASPTRLCLLVFMYVVYRCRVAIVFHEDPTVLEVAS